jgi:bifunctional DNase/RNase
MWIQMNVNTILFDSRNSSYIVVLKDETGKKILPIWIGAAEGNSIALALSNVKPARPLTHDLIVSIFDRLEVEIARVVISDLIETPFMPRSTFCTATGFISIPGSDAIAVAIRINAPVFVEEEVIAKQDSTTLDTWMKNLGESGGTE